MNDMMDTDGEKFIRRLCNLLSNITNDNFPCFCDKVKWVQWNDRDFRRAEKILEIIREFGQDILDVE